MNITNPQDRITLTTRPGKDGNPATTAVLVDGEDYRVFATYAIAMMIRRAMIDATQIV